MNDKMIKKLSRQLNKGTYLRSSCILLSAVICSAVFAALPYLIVRTAELSGIRSRLYSVNSYIFPAVSTVLFILITALAFAALSSVSMGEKAWYTGRLTRKKQCGKRLLFWFSPSYSFKAFRLNLLIFLLKLMWTAVFLSPAVLIFTVTAALSFFGGIEFYLFLSLAAGGTLLLVVGLMFRFFTVQRYFLAPYLLAQEPKLTAVSAVKQSKNLSDGHIFRIVRFKLKFFPAFLSYPLIIPVIFLHPHYKQSCSLIAKEICL